MKYLVTGTTSGIGKYIKQKLRGHELFEINRADIDLNRPELLLSVDLPVVDYAILNAGHDLDLNNLRFFKEKIIGLQEVSIGHALISDALYLGLENTIQMYKKLLNE